MIRTSFPNFRKSMRALGAGISMAVG